MYLGLVSHMFTVHVHICASVCRISRWPHRQRHGTQRVPLIPWAVRFAGQPRRGDVEDDLVNRRSTPNPRVEDPLFGAASCSYSASLPWVVAGTTQMPVTQTSIFWKAFFASFPHKCVFSKGTVGSYCIDRLIILGFSCSSFYGRENKVVQKYLHEIRPNLNREDTTRDNRRELPQLILFRLISPHAFLFQWTIKTPVIDTLTASPTQVSPQNN